MSLHHPAAPSNPGEAVGISQQRLMSEHPHNMRLFYVVSRAEMFCRNLMVTASWPDFKIGCMHMTLDPYRNAYADLMHSAPQKYHIDSAIAAGLKQRYIPRSLAKRAACPFLIS